MIFSENRYPLSGIMLLLFASGRVAGADERAQVKLEEQHHGCEREMIEETII
jgi:hypothetical protein